MVGMITDTTVEAAAVQLELLRRKSPRQKFDMLCSLTQTALFTRSRLRRAHPEFDDRSLQRLFIEIHYGPTLAKQVAAYLRSRQ